MPDKNLKTETTSNEDKTPKRGRPVEHKEITVSQVTNNAEYHRQYYHKILKKGKVKPNNPKEDVDV